MLDLRLAKDARDFINALESKQRGQVSKRLFELLTDPRPHDSIHMKGKDAEGYFRVDVGEFRIIYCFDKQFLYAAQVGKRGDNDVYDSFKRRKK